MFIHNNLNARECDVFYQEGFEECVFCSFQGGGGEKVLIGCIYRSPNSDDRNNECMKNIFRSEELFKYDKICIMGDFNYPFVEWNGVWKGAKAKEIEESVHDAFLIQMVHHPTRNRYNQRSTLDDWVLVSDESLISNITHLPPIGKSDHDTLLFNLYIPFIKKEENCKYKFQLARGDYDRMRQLIGDIDWTSNLYSKANTCSVNDMWLFIKGCIIDTMDKCIPKVKIKSESKTKAVWMNKSVLRCVKKKYKLYQRFLRSRTSKNYLDYIKLRNECNKMIKAARRDYEKLISNACKKNPKQFWKFVQDKTKVFKGIATLKKSDGSIADTDREKTDLLNSFFTSVFTKENLEDLPSVDLNNKSNGITLHDISVTPKAVELKLRELNPSKAQGPDLIPPKVLKELCKELAHPLAYLFNVSLESGSIPDDWKKADVTAIFKKGSRSDPENYRPISLTCLTCKVLESLIRDQLVAYFDDYNLYTEGQFGFRKKRSCVLQLLKVIDKLLGLIDNGNSVDIIYFDFRKAFDTVPHERLLIKLQRYGISGKVLSWIRCFLSDRVQKVRLGNESSEEGKVLSGIPQGSILGPILFTIFINDLPEGINSSCYIFADDTKIFGDANNCDVLNEDLIKLQNWTDSWNLYFNVAKCKVMHLGKRNNTTDYMLQLNGIPVIIKSCDEEKDLGVIFDSSLNFDKHLYHIITKANQILGIIKRSFKYLNKEVLLKLYKSLVRPHLEYGNCVWYPHLKRQSIALEKIQRRATRILSDCTGMNYHERLKFFNLHSLKGRRIRGDMILAYKIFHGMIDIDPKDIFNLSDNNKTRCSEMKIFVEHTNLSRTRSLFRHRIAKLWNNLPTNVKNIENLDHFKNWLDGNDKFNKIFFDFDNY